MYRATINQCVCQYIDIILFVKKKYEKQCNFAGYSFYYDKQYDTKFRIQVDNALNIFLFYNDALMLQDKNVSVFVSGGYYGIQFRSNLWLSDSGNDIALFGLGIKYDINTKQYIMEGVKIDICCGSQWGEDGYCYKKCKTKSSNDILLPISRDNLMKQLCSPSEYEEWKNYRV
jgi:hypothetical protein